MITKEKLIVQALGQQLGRDADFYTAEEVLIAAGLEEREVKELKTDFEKKVVELLKEKEMKVGRLEHLKGR